MYAAAKHFLSAHGMQSKYTDTPCSAGKPSVTIGIDRVDNWHGTADPSVVNVHFKELQITGHAHCVHHSSIKAVCRAKWDIARLCCKDCRVLQIFERETNREKNLEKAVKEAKVKARKEAAKTTESDKDRALDEQDVAKVRLPPPALSGNSQKQLS